MDGHLWPPGAGGGRKPPSQGLPEGAQPCPVPVSDLRPPGRREEALLQPRVPSSRGCAQQLCLSGAF